MAAPYGGGALYFSNFIKRQKRRSPALLRRLMRNLDSGLYDLPASLGVLSRFAPEELRLDQGQPVRMQLPENQLMGEFLRLHPEAKTAPVELQSSQPPIARQFARRQLELITKQGLSKSQAFQQTRMEMGDSLRALARQQGLTGGAHLQLRHAEEEKQLRAALDTVVRKGIHR